MSDEPRLEEQLLSQEVKRRVSEQLDAVDNIEIDVRTDLLKIFQGQIDEVSVTGQGLITAQNIRVQEIKVQTNSIAVNPLSAIFGQIKLAQPVNAVAQITLTEADINHSLNADFIRSFAENFQLNIDGKIISFELQKIQVFLPNEDKIEFRVTGLLKENRNTRLLGIIAVVRPRTKSQPIMLESVKCTQGDGISVEEIVAFMQKIKEITNLPFIQWEDIAFRVKEMKIQKGSLTLLAEVNVREIPAV